MAGSNGNSSKIYKIIIGGSEVEYTLKRSSRKSIGISIDKAGAVTVAAPYRVSENSIRELLNRKAVWILDKISHMQLMASQAVKHGNFSVGEEYPYLGINYKLKPMVDYTLKRPVFRLGQENLELYYNEPKETDMLLDFLKLWYVEQFKRVIEDRVSHFAGLMRVRPGRITVREQKTRWGSCSSRGNLNFNWRLIMAPAEVLDYVVIHELSHLTEMNHSDRFWALVQKWCPNYKLYRKWLKQNGNKLNLG